MVEDQCFIKPMLAYEKEIPIDDDLPPILRREERVDGVFCGWSDLGEHSTTLRVFLFDPLGREQGINPFFSAMVCEWLLPGGQLPLLSYRNIRQEGFEGSRGNLSEIVVAISPSQVTLIQRNLPAIAKEIAAGAISPIQMGRHLALKGAFRSRKEVLMYSAISARVSRHPSLFEPTVFEDLHRLVLLSREEFRLIREVPHLCRLVTAKSFLLKELRREIKADPGKRHIRVKLMRARLHFPFGVKRVLGVAICLNLLHENESFERRHLLRALSQLLPETRAIQESEIDHREGVVPLRFLYLEVEIGEEGLPSAEFIRLREELPKALRGAVEQLMPCLFNSSNDEEVYRHLMSLNRELSDPQDLPHVMIAFLTQAGTSLSFRVIIARIRESDEETIDGLISRRAPKETACTLEHLFPLARLRRRRIKEGASLRFLFPRDRFVRKDYAVDLVKAREYIAQTVREIFGEFRDCNGGLLQKQGEQLKEVKSLLGCAWDELLIENLFYSLTPAFAQGTLSPELLVNFFQLFISSIAASRGSSREPAVHTRHEEETFYLLVTNPPAGFKEDFESQIKAPLFEPQALVSTHLTVDGCTFIGYLYPHCDPLAAQSLDDSVQRVLQSSKAGSANSRAVRINVPVMAPFLDPRIAQDRISGIVIKMLYEGLMRMGSKGRAEPAAAEEVFISPDGKTYLFTLRQSRWSDGSTLTAADFEYAWKKILDPSLQTPHAFLFYPIKNAKAVKEGSLPIDAVGVRALGPRLLKIDLENPTSHFLDLTTLWIYSPLHRELDQRSPGWAYYGGSEYVCNGPFIPALWRPNQLLQLAKNPLYWGADSVHLEKIEIDIFDDPDMALSLFRQGHLDWVGDPLWELPTTALHSLREEGVLASEPTVGTFIVDLNVTRFPFQSSKIRSALACAIDRREIIDSVLQGDEECATSIIPPLCRTGSLFQRDTSRIESSSPDDALALFEEGLLELGITRNELPTFCINHSTHIEHVALAKAIGHQWEEVLKVSVSYTSLPWQRFSEQLFGGDFLIGVRTLFALHKDPIYFLDLLCSADRSVNPSGWRDPVFKKLVTKAHTSLSVSERHAHLQDAELLLQQEMPIIPIYYYRSRFLKSRSLKDVVLSPTGQIDFRWASIHR